MSSYNVKSKNVGGANIDQQWSRSKMKGLKERRKKSLEMNEEAKD